MKDNKNTFVLLCTTLYLLIAFYAYGQTAGTGAIIGTVRDTSGAVIPGANVQAVNADTRQTRTVLTGADGGYRFALLPPGSYNLRFSANGFKTADIARIAVAVTETPVQDQRLELGTQAEQITVEATAEMLQTSSSARGGTVTQKTLTDLPLTTRNYTNVMAMSSGVSAGVTNATALGVSGMDMNVNGAPTSSNNISIDGQNIQNPGESSGQTAGFGNGGYNFVPNPDAIQEFKVQTSTYDAGFGRNIGANVNVVTKSGTNAIHGSVFEFFRNTTLNANDFFLNLSGTAKGVLNQNQFGGVLGGPIRKDKLFFFGSYQGTRQKNGVGSQGTTTLDLPPIPTGDRANMAAFQATLGALNCPANHAGAQYQTLHGGVQVACDGSNINPIAIRLLQTTFLSGPSKGSYLMPGSSNGGFQTETITIPASFAEDQVLANIDYLMSSKNTLSQRFFFSNAPAILPFPSATHVPGFTTPYNYRNWGEHIKLTTVVSSSMVNELRLNFHREDSGASLDQSGLTTAQFGITPLSPSVPAMAIFNISGVYLVGSGGTAGSQLGPDNSNAYTAADQISWTRGKHTIRAGFEATQYRWHWNLLGLGVGDINMGSFADFLIGRAGCLPASATCSPTNPGNTNGTQYSNISSTNTTDEFGPAADAHSFRQHYFAGFVTDDFKASPRLTLNMGLRYEYDGALTEEHGVLTNVWRSAILKPGFAIPPSTSCVPQCDYAGWVEPSNYPAAGVYGQVASNLPGFTIASNPSSLRGGPPKTNFAPRLGFAWQPVLNGKFVVRGGVGIFYDFVPGENYIFAVNNSPPLATAVGKSQTANYFATEAAPFLTGLTGTFLDRWANFDTLLTSAIGQQVFPEDMKTPIEQSYNLNIQYNFLPNWVLEVGYVGAHAYHINNAGGVYDPGAIASIATKANPINGLTTDTVANAILRVPYLGFQSLREQCTCFDSKFYSLQATLRKQLSHGLRFELAYTFARALTDSAVTQDLLNFKNNYGPNVAIHPQRVVVNYSYNLPGGQLKGISGKILGGWALSGVTTIQNGTPINITDSRGGTIFGNFSTAGALSRAQLAPGKTYDDIATPGSIGQRLGGATGGCGYFASYQSTSTLNGKSCASLSPFTAIPNYLTPDGIVTNGTSWGNIGTGVILGPGQLNFDAAMLRNTRLGSIHENALLQFRAEFFNLMNHPQFANPAANMAAPGTFGSITGTTVNPRLIQFAVKYIF
jgi:hypothetical protein